MNASNLETLISNNGGWAKVVYISLNNGKQLLVTEDMKTGPDAIRIEGEFIRIKNDRYFANGMNDFLPRQVIEFHAIEFVECIYFAQNDESLLKPASYAEFTTDRNFDIADTIEDKTHQASIRVSHPNLEVKSGGTLTKEYEITMSGEVTQIKLSGRNEQLKMAESITNMYALPFDRDALLIERVESTTEALFNIKAYRKGTHEILVRIGSQELYFKVIVGDDDTLTVKQPAVVEELIAEEETESVVTEVEKPVEEEVTEPAATILMTEEEPAVAEEPIVEEPVVNEQVETTEEEKQETVIVLGFSTKTLANGKTHQMEVLVEPEQSVTFTSSNESVATVSETGLITVVADSGQSTIKVTAADGTTKSVVIKAKAAE